MKINLLAFIVLLTVISFLLRFFRLEEPRHYYFDEVYHAVTAKAYADNNPAPYDPFSPPPMQGTAYDWLHPPLAKLIQAGSIKVLGDKPIGWRLPSVVFGTAIIPAVFVLAFLIFGRRTAVFASTAAAFENLNLVMSRITMNDVFVTFFIIMSFIFAYLYRKKGGYTKLFLTAIFLGLAAASKWTGAYAIAAVFVFIVIGDFKKNQLYLRNLFLLLVPGLIYLAGYSQYFLQGHTISQFKELHRQIWIYQNRHDLEHPYGTTPLFCVPKGLGGEKTFCPWVLNARPVYLSYEAYGQTRAGYIYALGNPFVYWLGFGAVLFLTWKFFKKRKTGFLLVLLGYFVFWVPWIFSPRIMFMYHYLPSIPFMAIALGYLLSWLWKGKYKAAAVVITGLIIGAFFYFYPITSGYPIEITAIENYMWLKTWR